MANYRDDYQYVKELPDGRWVGVRLQLFGTARAVLVDVRDNIWNDW